MGCAGGNRTCCTLPVHREPYAASAWRVAVSGLLGGHSGVFINQGRGNASILLGRMLQELSLHMDLRLVLVRGGLKDNAIPVAAEAQILVPPGADVQGLCAAFASVLQKEFRRSDPGIAWNVSPCQPELTPMDQASTARCLCLLTCAPNGLQELSQDMPGLPQTSLNLGVLTTSPEALDAVFSLRSSLPGRFHSGPGRLSRMGIPGGVSPAGPAGGSLSGAVRKRPQHRSHPRGTGMRRSLQKNTGAGLRVLWSQYSRHPHPPGENGGCLCSAGLETAAGGLAPQPLNPLTCRPARKFWPAGMSSSHL